MAKITNAMKYKTIEERVKAFGEFCKNEFCNKCNHTDCRLHKQGSVILHCYDAWLALEAEEKPEPCFLCGSETFVNTHSEGYEVRCTQRNCYIGKTFENKEAAIAAHNRVCRAVKDFPVLEKMKIELLNIAHNGSKTTVAEIVEKYLTVKGEDSNKEGETLT